MLAKLKYIYHTIKMNYYADILNSLIDRESIDYKKYERKFNHHYVQRWKHCKR
jgi:hypothetical protein